MSENLRVKTNIGFVPSDWNKIKIENIVTEISRFSKDDNIPLYSLTINEGLICKPQKYEREFLVKDEDDNYKIIKKDEFALNPMNLRFGAIAKMKNDNCARVSKYYNIFKFNELVDSNFLEAFLKSERVLNYYNRMATGTLEEKKRVHFSQFIKFEFYLPPLIEQQKIAEILSTLDLAIEKQEQLIEKKKEFKKGLMQRLLSGEVRFKEFKDEWKEVKLNTLGKFIRGVSYKPEDLSEYESVDNISLLRSNNILNNQIVYEDIQLVNALKVKEEQKLIMNDIVICMANGSKSLVGKNGLFKMNNNDRIFTVGAFCSIFRSNNNVNKQFMKYIFESNRYNLYVHNLLAGSNINNLKGSEIGNMKFLISNSLDEQKKIAEVLGTVDKEVELLKKELEALKLQKKGLMQRLFTGEVRVKI